MEIRIGAFCAETEVTLLQ